MGLCLPIIGICLYLIKGNPELAIPGANLSGTEQAGLRSLELLAQDKAGYQAQVAQWKQDLVAKPDAVNTWLSLALLHKAAGDYGEALQSFGEALRRGADQDARSLAEFAETIALARDKRFEGEPYELLKRAMTIDPNDSKVVSLMAAAHYQVGEKAQARALLEQLLAAMPPESAQAEQLRALIASLPGAASATETTITVSLAISPAMLQGLAPAAVLYVSARAAQGPRMPIAVWRARVSELKFDAQADQGAGPEQAHAQKTLQATYPGAWYYNPTFPTGTLTCWPVPTSSTLQGVLYTPTPVAEFSALTDVVSLPPGYRRFLRTNLAVELAPTFQVQPSPVAVELAVASKAA
ncbi:MAG: hypothetical protein EBW55_13090, partial [Betaproteobacteria bacterium]|nr:hypothetical protein [Betaproteobacteria bacterium]